MGRPIKKEFIGGPNVASGDPMLVITQAYIPGASAVSNDVKIVSQKGTGRYIVTDGTNTGLVSLVDGSNGYTPVSGEAIMDVAVYSNVSTNVYTPATITLNNGGSGYTAGDVLTIPNCGIYTVSIVSTAVVGGTIETGTSTLSTTQYTSDNSGEGVTSTGGTGTGALFHVETTSSTTYLPKAASLNAAGTGYKVNDTITLTNVGVLTVTAIGTDGAVSTYTSALNGTAKSTDMAGTGIAQASTSGSGTGATFDVTSTSTTVYPLSSVIMTSGGKGYTVGDNLTVGEGLATYKVETVTTAQAGGVIQTGVANVKTTHYTVDMAGTGISPINGSGSGATFDVTSTTSTVSGSTEYASKIFDRTVVTFEDHVYQWNLLNAASAVGQADLTKGKKN